MAEEKQIVLTGQQLMNAYRQEESKLQALQQRMQQLNGLLMEANIAEDAVNEIKKAAKNEKIIVDLGAGTYVEAALDGNNGFKTGLAGTILQNSDSKGALEYLKKQKDMLQGEISGIAKEHEKTIASLNEIASWLQAGENQARKELAEKHRHGD
ncbi:MAG: prefoldin domain-containing protein [Candidatus ainarchaeum sp.]|nr:prefoldin domain-containing protein [Candidatus ainarchaeum sp.]